MRVSVTTYFVLIGYRLCSETRSLSSQHVYSNEPFTLEFAQTAVQFSLCAVNNP